MGTLIPLISSFWIYIHTSIIIDNRRARYYFLFLFLFLSISNDDRTDRALYWSTQEFVCFIVFICLHKKPVKKFLPCKFISFVKIKSNLKWLLPSGHFYLLDLIVFT